MDWLGFFIPRINLRKTPMESLNPPHDDDLDRIDELREQGSKLQLPHPVRAYLVFEREDMARQAANLLGKEGYNCSVRSIPDGGWLTTAITQIVPTPGAITKLREQFEAIGTANDGTYRGWDAPIVY